MGPNPYEVSEPELLLEVRWDLKTLLELVKQAPGYLGRSQAISKRLIINSD